MNEAVSLRRNLYEDRGVGGLLAALEIVLRVVFVAGFEQSDIELSSNDRAMPERSNALRRHRGESLLDGGANRSGNRRPRGRGLRAP